MKLTWEREDIVSSDDEFAEMASAVAKFVQTNSVSYQRTAMEKVAAIRSKEVGTLGQLLDDLYRDLQSGVSTSADARLTQVINQKREAKSKCKTSSRKQPIK